MKRLCYLDLNTGERKTKADVCKQIRKVFPTISLTIVSYAVFDFLRGIESSEEEKIYSDRVLKLCEFDFGLKTSLDYGTCYSFLAKNYGTEEE